MAIDGTYKVTGEAKGVAVEGTIEVKTDGDTLTGTAHLRDIEMPLEDGKVNGNDFTCNVVAPTPMGNMKFKVQGTVDGDKVSGTLKALLVKASFSGERIA